MKKLTLVPSRCSRCGASISVVDWRPLKELRQKADVSRSEMAERLGCSVSYVTAIETGRRRVTDFISNVYARLA